MKRWLISISLCFLFGFCSGSLSAQTDEVKLTAAQELSLIIVSKIEVPEVNYAPKPKPIYWKKGVFTQFGASQISLTNWSAGGDASFSMNAFIDMTANYQRESFLWENRLTMAYGFIQPFGDKYKKSDDRILLDSKAGYRAIDKLYISAVFNFRTQFTNGFEYPSGEKKLMSQAFSPAYLSLGLGLDYKPYTWLSVNFAPVTGAVVIVSRPELRTRYGNKEDEAVRKEFGAQFRTEIIKQWKKVKVDTKLTLFSDFLKNPENIQVHWDFGATVILTDFISASLRTNFIYDDNVLIADSDGVKAARPQFKEIFGINFSYTFGNYVKKK